MKCNEDGIRYQLELNIDLGAAVWCPMRFIGKIQSFIFGRVKAGI
jgi:hypothetical protein